MSQPWPWAGFERPLKTRQQLLKRDCEPKLRRYRHEQRFPAGRSCTGHEAGTSPAEAVVRSTSANHIAVMCRRVIQSSAPIRYAIVDGMNVRDSRVHNYPPRWNGAPSQDLLVIRRNHKTGEVSLDPLRWGLIPYWCDDPKGGRKPIMMPLPGWSLRKGLLPRKSHPTS